MALDTEERVDPVRAWRADPAKARGLWRPLPARRFLRAEEPGAVAPPGPLAAVSAGSRGYSAGGDWSFEPRLSRNARPVAPVPHRRSGPAGGDPLQRRSGAALRCAAQPDPSVAGGVF